MHIWNSKTVLIWLAAFLAAGCDKTTPAGLFGPAERAALRQVNMADGEITLVAPPGFCIDRAALRPQFALLARCDVLGMPTTNEDAPVGVISVSVAPAAGLETLPSPQQIASASNLGPPRDAQSSAGFTIFRASGKAPVEGMAQIQWRAAALIGDFLFGVTLYGPEGGRAISDEGADLVKELVTGTQASSATQ